jgi:hypothetical protein
VVVIWPEIKLYSGRRNCAFSVWNGCSTNVFVETDMKSVCLIWNITLIENMKWNMHTVALAMHGTSFGTYHKNICIKIFLFLKLTILFPEIKKLHIRAISLWSWQFKSSVNICKETEMSQRRYLLAATLSD